ncbi:ATP-binding cassette domain-containing protein [Thiotrichales bacterium 19X7-9]|nr:ATP-binding cassette domain-containing protein [Thiotrichales bacterium 19X7-9]
MFEINNISYAIGSKSLVKDISFSLKSKHFFGLLGANGAGKSTVLKLMLNDLVIQQGSITIDNLALNQWPLTKLAQTVSVIYQHYETKANLTVLDVVLLGRIPYCNGFYQDCDYNQAIEALKLVDAYKLIDKAYPYLSGGEKARVQLARALTQLMKPNISGYLLLDEPGAHMDSYYQKHTFELLKDLTKNYNLSVMMIVHDLNLALQYLDEAILLKNAHMVTSGKIDQVLSNEHIYTAYQLETKRVSFDHPPYQTIVSL